MIRIIWKWLCGLIINLRDMKARVFLRNLNIRIHRDITGEMWFGVGWIVFSVIIYKFR